MRSCLSLALLVTLGCTTDPSSVGPSATYNPIAGTYVGAVSGTTEGSTLEGPYTLNLQQSAGSISGSYSFVATFSTGTLTMAGSVDGTMTAGDYPTVTLDLTHDICTNVKVRHTGTYDLALRRITLSGPIDLVNTQNNACSISRRLSTTVTMNR